MIVVAIIGILAAVAIPGFMTYIKNSKTSEAKTNLDAIKKGAIAFFETEHYAADGMSAYTKRYPGCNQTACTQPSTRPGVTPDKTTVGKKFSPTDYKTTFKAEPWQSLNFTIGSPFYYYYDYNTSLADGLNRFQAKASASLNEALDSIYYINGYSEGSASAVIELTVGSTDTAEAKAPSQDPLDSSSGT